MVDAIDDERIGDAALSHAVLRKSLPLVKLLVDYGANPMAQGWMHLAPLDRAEQLVAEEDSPEATRILKVLVEAAKKPR